jgi:hypothetical protein
VSSYVKNEFLVQLHLVAGGKDMGRSEIQSLRRAAIEKPSAVSSALPTKALPALPPASTVVSAAVDDDSDSSDEPPPSVLMHQVSLPPKLLVGDKRSV